MIQSNIHRHFSPSNKIYSSGCHPSLHQSEFFLSIAVFGGRGGTPFLSKEVAKEVVDKMAPGRGREEKRRERERERGLLLNHRHLPRGLWIERKDFFFILIRSRKWWRNRRRDKNQRRQRFSRWRNIDLLFGCRNGDHRENKKKNHRPSVLKRLWWCYWPFRYEGQKLFFCLHTCGEIAMISSRNRSI